MRTEKNIIGKQLRRLRYERGMSQPSFAAKCQRMGWDVTRDTIAKIEAHKRWVGDMELTYLARALNVSIEELLPAATRKLLNRASQ